MSWYKASALCKFRELWLVTCKALTVRQAAFQHLSTPEWRSNGQVQGPSRGFLSAQGSTQTHANGPFAYGMLLCGWYARINWEPWGMNHREWKSSDEIRNRHPKSIPRFSGGVPIKFPANSHPANRRYTLSAKQNCKWGESLRTIPATHQQRTFNQRVGKKAFQSQPSRQSRLRLSEWKGTCISPRQNVVLNSLI